MASFLGMSLAKMAKGQTEEGGFEHFYKDFIVMEPVPQADWICGETVKITWKQGKDIEGGETTTPAVPASGKVDIVLAQVNGLLPWSTDNITKLTIAVDVPMAAESLDFLVDCEALVHMCPECLHEDGSVMPSGAGDPRIYKMWNYLIFEDSAIYAEASCSKIGLNYDNDLCWAVRSQGAVNVGTKGFRQYDVVPGEDVFTEARGWHNEASPPQNNHLWGLAAIASHRVSSFVDQGVDMTLPDGFGDWEVPFAEYRGVIGNAILVSKEENLIIVGIRPTTMGIYAYDDWMTNFDIAQRGCTDVLSGCETNMKFHRGFMYEYEISKEKMRQTLVDTIKAGSGCAAEDPVQWKILFTGMSQGGGLANLMIFDMYNYIKAHADTKDDFDKYRWFTYSLGGPVTGNEHYALWMEKTIPPAQRDRFVARFDAENELFDDGSKSYYGGYMRIDDMNIGPVKIGEFKEVIECMNAVPPLGKDTPPYAGWYWKTAEELGDPSLTDEEVAFQNLVSWQDGDLVTLMRSNVDCKGFSGQLFMDSRFTPVNSPVFVHYDPDEYKPWCSETGCVATGTHKPPHPNAKKPARIYSTGMEGVPGGYRKHCANRAGPALGPAMSCHDTGIYAHGIAMLRNEVDLTDYNSFKTGGVPFSGCKNTGATLSPTPMTWVKPTLTSTTTTTTEYKTAGALSSLAVSMLCLLALLW